MAFTPEDGTGLANANSLATVEFADSYATDRGMDDWMTVGLTDKQVLLVRATDHLQKCFRFRGYPLEDAQALCFPRGGIYSPDSGLEYPPLPIPIMQAVVEFALRLRSVDLLPAQDALSAEGVITAKSTQVGPIKESVDFLPGAAPSRQLAVPAAEFLLRDFTYSGRSLERS